MDSYIKDVIDREFKDQFVRKVLYLIIPNLIAYYGEKYLNTIFDAIKNITIYICPANYPFNHFINNKISVNLDSHYSKVFNSSLNNRQGLIYEEHPRVVVDEDTKEFRNIGTERKIIFIKEQSTIVSKNNKEELKCATIIRGLVSLIKSNNANNTIRNDTKRTRFGLHQTIYKLVTQKNKVETIYLSETGFGLYNGILEYDTEEIFKRIYGYPLKEHFYPLEKYIVEKLFVSDALKSIFHEVEITGNIFLLRNCYDKIYYDGAFDKLIGLTDTINNSDYKKSQRDYDEAVREINKYFISITRKNPNLKHVASIEEINKYFNSNTKRNPNLKYVA